MRCCAVSTKSAAIRVAGSTARQLSACSRGIRRTSCCSDGGIAARSGTVPRVATCAGRGLQVTYVRADYRGRPISPISCTTTRRAGCRSRAQREAQNPLSVQNPNPTDSTRLLLSLTFRTALLRVLVVPNAEVLHQTPQRMSCGPTRVSHRRTTTATSAIRECADRNGVVVVTQRVRRHNVTTTETTLPAMRYKAVTERREGSVMRNSESVQRGGWVGSFFLGSCVPPTASPISG